MVYLRRLVSMAKAVGCGKGREAPELDRNTKAPTGVKGAPRPLPPRRT